MQYIFDLFWRFYQTHWFSYPSSSMVWVAATWDPNPPQDCCVCHCNPEFNKISKAFGGRHGWMEYPPSLDVLIRLKTFEI